MVYRLSAFVIWALVAATTVFWGLRLWARPLDVPQYTVPAGEVAVARGDLSRLLGATPAVVAVVEAAPEAASRFRLIGIMAPKAAATSAHPGQGVALIAVDGNPPKAFVVGSALDTDMVLRSVSLRTAAIGPAQGAASFTLELPPLAAATTGTLPALGSGAARTPTAVPVPVRAVAQPPQAAPQRPVGQLRSPQPSVDARGLVPTPPMPRDPAAQTLTQ